MAFVPVNLDMDSFSGGYKTCWYFPKLLCLCLSIPVSTILRRYFRVNVRAWHFADVAHRWKTQFNENSKLWCFWEELPEANHNAIVGFRLPEQIAKRALVIFLRGAALHPRIRLRYEFTRQALDEAGVASETVDAEGKSPLVQMMSSVLFGDYVSLYLAILAGVDPSPTAPIADLKRWLAEQP